MQPRMIGALVLCPTSNAQGSFVFLSLETGCVINHLHATAIPMPDKVIDKVHHLTRQQKANPGLVFTDQNMMPFNEDQYDDDDSGEDSDYVDNVSEDDDNNSYDSYKNNDDDLLENPKKTQIDEDDDNADHIENPGIPGVDGVDGVEIGEIDNPEIPGLTVFANANPGLLVDEEAGVDAPHNDMDVSNNEESNQEEDENANNHLIKEVHPHLNEEEEVPTQEGDAENNEVSRQQYNLCKNRTCNYQH